MIFYRRIMRIDIPLTRFLPYHLAIFQTTFYQSPNIYRCHCRCIITFFFYRPVSLRNWKLAKISHERAAVNRQLIIKRRGNFLEEEVCKLKTLVSFRLLTLFETVLDNSITWTQSLHEAEFSRSIFKRTRRNARFFTIANTQIGNSCQIRIYTENENKLHGIFRTSSWMELRFVSDTMESITRGNFSLNEAFSIGWGALCPLPSVIFTNLQTCSGRSVSQLSVDRV